ncbi:DUF3761 domain-containing protein [Sphingomonas abietis]|uniref:DUF3761 domain-containing protein n=1 Tax=Sphingomonas abietis TaxID=3012344 RepID=UPI00389A0F12
MKKLLTAVALVVALVPATGSMARRSHSVASYGYGDAYYTNVSGHRVHRPVRSSNRPTGASARCGDGSWSFSEHHQGTCSHHGGVSSWL